MMDRLALLSPRFFAKDASSALQRIEAGPSEFRSDGDRWVLEFSATDSFFSAGTLDAPLVPRAGRLAPDFARSTIELQFEGMSEGNLERLIGLNDCETLALDLPPTDQWWAAEYLAESTSTGDWLYLMGLGDLGGDTSNQHYFVFHGPRGDVRQRELFSFARTRDGHTTFSYEVDGDLVKVEFPGKCDASQITRLCPGTMSVENEEHDLESRWDGFPGALADLSFYCQYTIASQ
jgi:hypothetical protein